MSSVGDVNGDGLADVLLTARLTYVVYGKAGGGVMSLDSVAVASGGFRIFGVRMIAISPLFRIGRWRRQWRRPPRSPARGFRRLGMTPLPARGSAGRPTWFSATQPRHVDLAEVAAGSGGFKILAEGLSNDVGFSVSDIGDLNNDGLADLLVGAPGNHISTTRQAPSAEAPLTSCSGRWPGTPSIWPTWRQAMGGLRSSQKTVASSAGSWDRARLDGRF